MSYRVGQGFDVHAFTTGTSVTICGMEIRHTHGLKGHSDADVGLHAITDAILGAIGGGDIGEHFPPSDVKWRDADSSVFLQHAIKLLAEKGGKLHNIDATIICEKPKITPHKQEMKNNVAEIAKINPSQVNIKATTTEQLGFLGREEGIAALAVASVEIID